MMLVILMITQEAEEVFLQVGWKQAILRNPGSNAAIGFWIFCQTFGCLVHTDGLKAGSKFAEEDVAIVALPALPALPQSAAHSTVSYSRLGGAVL